MKDGRTMSKGWISNISSSVVQIMSLLVSSSTTIWTWNVVHYCVHRSCTFSTPPPAGCSNDMSIAPFPPSELACHPLSICSWPLLFSYPVGLDFTCTHWRLARPTRSKSVAGNDGTANRGPALGVLPPWRVDRRATGCSQDSHSTAYRSKGTCTHWSWCV